MAEVKGGLITVASALAQHLAQRDDDVIEQALLVLISQRPELRERLVKSLTEPPAQRFHGVIKQITGGVLLSDHGGQSAVDLDPSTEEESACRIGCQPEAEVEDEHATIERTKSEYMKAVDVLMAIPSICDRRTFTKWKLHIAKSEDSVSEADIICRMVKALTETGYKLEPVEKPVRRKMCNMAMPPKLLQIRTTIQRRTGVRLRSPTTGLGVPGGPSYES